MFWSFTLSFFQTLLFSSTRLYLSKHLSFYTTINWSICPFIYWESAAAITFNWFSAAIKTRYSSISLEMSRDSRLSQCYLHCHAHTHTHTPTCPPTVRSVLGFKLPVGNKLKLLTALTFPFTERYNHLTLFHPNPALSRLVPGTPQASFDHL